MAKKAVNKEEKPKKKKAITKPGAFGPLQHMDNLTINKLPWESMTETEQKSFLVFIINKWLSMNHSYTDIINQLQRYTIGILEPREVYKLYLGFFPNSKLPFSRYIKSKRLINYNKELLEYMVIWFGCSEQQAISYLNIYYKTDSGLQQVIDILRKFGIENKKIDKLIKVKQED